MQIIITHEEIKRIIEAHFERQGIKLKIASVCESYSIDDFVIEVAEKTALEKWGMTANEFHHAMAEAQQRKKDQSGAEPEVKR